MSAEALDFGAPGLRGTVFSVANDRKGNAYLNDSRTPSVWVNLDWVDGTPSCVVDTAVSTVEGGVAAPTVVITLLSRFGVAYEATCAITATPFTSTNIAAACGAGFTALPNTPVGGLDALEHRHDHHRDHHRG
ncbi:hypothetical protein ACFYO2_19115 [Streptomyces sp. NPDC006602]|uniref:hypothetical protein n=1 Tax=Streptomyces sp. NPDC006602 TaxID=3364751 RepID=UPI00367F0AC0